MLNKEKVVLMTKLASYEENEGKKDFKIVERTKMDYISYHAFATLFFTTIAVFIVFVAAVGVEFLNDLTIFSTYDYVGKGVELATIWIIVMIVYGIVTGRIYRKQYNKAKKRVEEYKEQVRKLDEYK